MIDVGRVEIIDPIADGIIHHRLGLLFVDLVSLAIDDRQAHTAKTQDRELLTGLAGLSI